ncbi:protein lin-41-like [Mizuhopecten yessoensis]|uniref:B box-type domain-containing protein n=1 Tax=Mizuhopecten yessoensis TaxID=6573 RepID=A0A210QC29_MIZYE|nr:protein lin-41-like [Mizuhopecten yessoensis]OWF46278.1 hypothetical protein KP79_PYT12992 [Mizuhopecten yessoensis]
MADTIDTACGCGSRNISLFCNDCECFLCSDCLVDNHKKHDFAKLHDVAKSKRIQLDEIVEEGRDSLVSLLQTNLAFIQENMGLETKNHDVVLGQISNRASFLEKELVSLKESYIKHLREFSQGRHHYLNGLQTLLSEVLAAALEYPAACDSEQNEAKNVQVVMLEMKLQRALSMISQMSKWPTTPCVELTYTDADKSSDHDISILKTLFGSIKQKNSESMKDISLMESMNNNVISLTGRVNENKGACVAVLDVDDAVCIDEMFPVAGSDEVFVKSGKSFYKTNLNKCKLFMSDIKDIAMMKDGTVLVINNEDTCVHQVLPDGASRVFANMCPCQPHCVFVSSTGSVQVVMQEEGHHPVVLAEFNNYEMKVKDMRVEDIDLSFVRFRKDISGRLYYIKMSYFPLIESVHVLNETESNPNPECYPIAGIFGYDPSAACRPLDACIDDEGRVIIVDHKNNAIYLQDQEGRLVSMLVAPQQHLLTSPRSVLLVKDQLWIACDDRKIHIFNYKQLIMDRKKEAEVLISDS